MARYELTIDEYKVANFVDATRPWKRWLAWAVAGVLLVGSVAMGQYAFSVLWFMLLAFLYITTYRVGPRLEQENLDGSPFARGPYELELRDESYTVRVGGSELRLSASELWRVHDFGPHYRLDHRSDVALVVPKRALDAEETAIIERYRDRFPGMPENQAPPWGAA